MSENLKGFVAKNIMRSSFSSNEVLLPLAYVFVRWTSNPDCLANPRLCIFEPGRALSFLRIRKVDLK